MECFDKSLKTRLNDYLNSVSVKGDYTTFYISITGNTRLFVLSFSLRSEYEKFKLSLY